MHTHIHIYEVSAHLARAAPREREAGAVLGLPPPPAADARERRLVERGGVRGASEGAWGGV